MESQCTLKKSFSLSGITLHGGNFCRLKVIPAKENTGIIFITKNKSNAKPIKVSIDNAVEFERRTTISNGIESVNTIEHLLAAFYSQGIDNVICKLSSSELPIFDGSALTFVEAIRSAGIHYLSAKKRVLEVRKPFFCKLGDAKAKISPSEHLRFECSVEYDRSLIAKQSYSYTLSADSFYKDIAGARTFCSYKDLEYLFDNNLSLGGSLGNANILDGERIYCKGKMRYKNEFVRHKILDMIGDFALLNARLKLHISCYKPGHFFNNLIAKKILEYS